MLFKYENGEMVEVKKMPHFSDYQKEVAKIGVEDLLKIREVLQEKLDTSDEVITSSWIPGNSWDGTVFYPIYEAVQGNQKKAAQLFGSILKEVVMNDERQWSYGKYQKNGNDIKGNTYFTIKIKK